MGIVTVAINLFGPVEFFFSNKLYCAIPATIPSCILLCLAENRFIGVRIDKCNRCYTSAIWAFSFSLEREFFWGFGFWSVLKNFNLILELCWKGKLN